MSVESPPPPPTTLGLGSESTGAGSAAPVVTLALMVNLDTFAEALFETPRFAAMMVVRRLFPLWDLPKVLRSL